MYTNQSHLICRLDSDLSEFNLAKCRFETYESTVSEPGNVLSKDSAKSRQYILRKNLLIDINLAMFTLLGGTLVTHCVQDGIRRCRSDNHPTTADLVVFFGNLFLKILQIDLVF